MQLQWSAVTKLLSTWFKSLRFVACIPVANIIKQTTWYKCKVKAWGFVVFRKLKSIGSLWYII